MEEENIVKLPFLDFERICDETYLDSLSEWQKMVVFHHLLNYRKKTNKLLKKDSKILFSEFIEFVRDIYR
jgi:hypothetical protein